MPHKNWRFGSLTPSTPLRYDHDSPSSPRSPLDPIRLRPTASSHLASRPPAKAPVRPFQLSCFSPPPTPIRSTDSLPKATSRIHTSTSSTSEITDSSTEYIPDSPRWWTWRCHLCSRRYNLGTTRRCLEDGHTLCYQFSEHIPPPSPPPPASNFGFSTEEMHYQKEKRKRERRRRKRENAARGCRSEFDYEAWEVWNLWRKEKRVDYEKAEGRNCWDNCAYPSECLNRMQRAARAKQAEEDEKEWNAMVYGNLNGPKMVSLEKDGSSGGWGRELRITPPPSSYLGHTDSQGEIMLEIGLQVYAPFEHEIGTKMENVNNKPPTAIEYTLPPEDLYSSEERELDEGPLGIEPDAGSSIEIEATFLQLRETRKTSTDGGRPSSPLKSCFGFDSEKDVSDAVMGGREGGRMSLSKDVMDSEVEAQGRDRECGNCRQVISTWENSDTCWFCELALEWKEGKGGRV